MKASLQWALSVAGIALATQAAAQVTFYEQDGFRGRSFTAERSISNFEQIGFNDRASSLVVNRGRWEVCTDARFSGQCVVLRPGQYESLRAVGLDNSVSSVRPVNRNARHFESSGAYLSGDDRYRRRGEERLFRADVTSVRAVVGSPEQRCWVEREQVPGYSGNANIPGAIAGAVIGGILGHQIGGGRGQDIATAGGAVGGAALGANIGRGNSGYAQDVRRCETVASGRPNYWDVTYNFRGAEHRVQMTAPPGPTIMVNANGEPRV